MSEESATTLQISEGASSTFAPSVDGQPILGFTKIVLGICLYAALAEIYYLMPYKQLHSFGQLRFTLDALLECVFTILSLPVFFLVHRYGVKAHEENLAFPVPELLIELLLVGSMIWLALSNGIHLTSKLAEQIVTSSGGHIELACTKDIHFLRQVVGHVAPHIGWQMLFVALMLGQLKRPYRGRRAWLSKYVPLWGVVFGLLFAQGTIAAGCMMLGFTLTAVSCAIFSCLAYKTRLPSHEIPVQRFFMFCQISFLLCMVMYWSVSFLPG